MDRRTIVSLGPGALSVACAVGAFKPGTTSPPMVLERLARGGERSQARGVIMDPKTGEPVVGALVIVQCSCLREGQRELVTKFDGRYDPRDLPPANISSRSCPATST